MVIMLVMIYVAYGKRCDNVDNDLTSSNNGANFYRASLRALTSGRHQVPSITWTMFAQVICPPQFFHA